MHEFFVNFFWVSWNEKQNSLCGYNISPFVIEIWVKPPYIKVMGNDSCPFHNMFTDRY